VVLPSFDFSIKCIGNNRPGNRAAPRHFQVLAGGQLDLRGVVEKFFLHSVVKFLPAVVGKGSDIIENKAVILGVELRGSLRIPSTPGRAKAVYQLAERGIIRDLLLRAGAHKSHQRPGQGQRHV
jgi:hypothetical protein